MEFGGITPYQGAITSLYAVTAVDIEENNWRSVFLCLQAPEPMRCVEVSGLSRMVSTPSRACLVRICSLRDFWDLSERLVEEKTGSLL